MRGWLVWGAVVLLTAVPLGIASTSPLLAWRDPVYILAGFAGIAAMVLLLIQPLLIGGHLAGLTAFRSRQVHKWVGGCLVVCVAVHVLGLWVTSPPDVVDALLFVSPTPFSVWGVIAMLAVFAAALLAASRERLRLPPRVWRGFHTVLTSVVVGGTVVHAMLIEGTMGQASKAILCVCVVLVMVKVVAQRRVWRAFVSGVR